MAKSYKDGMQLSTGVEKVLRNVNGINERTSSEELVTLYAEMLDEVVKALPHELPALQNCFLVMTGALKVQSGDTRTAAMIRIKEASQKMLAVGRGQFGEYFNDVARSMLQP